MSVLNKKPYINTVLESLSEENQVKLGNLINGTGDRTELLRIIGLPSGNRTNITTDDKGVHLCSLQIGGNLYNGYLMYSDDVCCLAWFTDFQTISMFNINVETQEYAIVSEYLDITELRGSLNILLVESGHAVKVQADDVDSGDATEGYALIADGNGGATWGEVSGGGATVYDFSNNANATLEDLLSEFGTSGTKTIVIKYDNGFGYTNSITGLFKVVDNHTNVLELYFQVNNNKLNGYRNYSITDTLANLGTILISTFFNTDTYLQEYSLPTTPSGIDNGKCLMPVYNMGYWELGYASPFPTLPSDASSKTYVLKAVNGTLTWVEE